VFKISHFSYIVCAGINITYAIVTLNLQGQVTLKLCFDNVSLYIPAVPAPPSVPNPGGLLAAWLPNKLLPPANPPPKLNDGAAVVVVRPENVGLNPSAENQYANLKKLAFDLIYQ